MGIYMLTCLSCIKRRPYLTHFGSPLIFYTSGFHCINKPQPAELSVVNKRTSSMLAMNSLEFLGRISMISGKRKDRMLEKFKLHGIQVTIAAEESLVSKSEYGRFSVTATKSYPPPTAVESILSVRGGPSRFPFVKVRVIKSCAMAIDSVCKPFVVNMMAAAVKTASQTNDIENGTEGINTFEVNASFVYISFT